MKISPKTMAERILLMLFAGFVAGSFFSGAARSAELMDVLMVDSELEETESAPSPYAANSVNVVAEEEQAPASTGDALADNISAEERLNELQAQIAKMQEDLAKKQDKPAPSKKFQNKIGGIIIMDALPVDQSGGNTELYNDVNDMYALREARLSVKGTGYDVLSYECTVALQTSNSQRSTGLFFKNIQVGVKDVPVLQNVKVGHFKVETCMSERDLLINAPGISYFSGNTMSFSPHRRFGVASTRLYADKKLRIFNGLYSGRGFSDAANVLDDAPGLILDTRITAVPIYMEDSAGDLQEVFHIGGSAFWYLPGSPSNTLKMRARPTSWTGGMQYLLNSSIPLEDGYNVCEGEAAWQFGQFGVSSETFVANIDNYGTSWGSTLATRYFLRPGNYRTYSLDGGGFGNAHLVNNLAKGENSTGILPDTLGELELVGMYAYTNMDNLKNVASTASATTIYGELHEAIFGVNWWWNPDLRWSCAYTQGYCNSAKAGDSKKKSSVNSVDLQLSAQF